MRFPLLFKALTSAPAVACAALLGAGCATDPAPMETQLTECVEPRPQICTMIWAPVCAVHGDGHRETHASDCNACADASVLAHAPGACPENGNAAENGNAS